MTSVKPPLSATGEDAWRPFTNTAVFTSIPPTKAFPGRVVANIKDTSQEKNPCSFLVLFKSFRGNQQKGDNLMKCNVNDSNQPVLEIDSKKISIAPLPIASAKVTRRFLNDHQPEDKTDLDIVSDGVHYSFFASAKEIDFFSVTKQPWSKYKFIASLVE